MPLSPRLSRLERTTTARAAKAATLTAAVYQDEIRATMNIIMADPTAFGLAGACLSLCPVASPDAHADIERAIAERPELAMAFKALCERLDAIEAAA